MTKDFKTTDSASNPAANQYGISWVVGGIAVGLLAGAAVYALASNGTLELNFNAVTKTPVVTTEDTKDSQASSLEATSDENDVETVAQAEPTDERPGFTYYAVLPQLELDVNEQMQEEVEITETTPTTPPRPAAEANNRSASTIAAGGRIMFQLGSYKTQAQAVQLQKRASQNGLNTRVETATIRGETWYRVRLGPTEDMNIVNRWKQMLAGMGISPMVIRL